MKTRAAFTMVELVVTVAIIGILSAIAVPSWIESQNRAKRAEVPANVEGIRVSELGYFATFDTFLPEASWYPQALAGDESNKRLKDWPEADKAGGFTQLGWRPYGAVRGAYSIPDGDADSFEIQGLSDVDGDNDEALYWCTEAAACGWEPGDENVY
jgi:prepilin-type N-terminal cleavage/methylation domain-containing protein